LPRSSASFAATPLAVIDEDRHRRHEVSVQRREALALFGANLRRWRRRRRLSQARLSQRSGIASGEISWMERGLQEPRVGTLIKLADALRVSPAALLSGLGEHT
jgi:DNA-binding XRE family transcriptional regulator